MARPLPIVLLVLLVAAAGLFWWWSNGEAPPPAPMGPTVEASSSAAGVTADTSQALAVDQAPVRREAAPTRRGELLDDADIQAGLTGFQGRVVNHQKQPVADCGVRIYRGAMDSVLPEDVDLFAEQLTKAPNYVAGETRTAADGKFLITGVWPRAFYLLFAGIGTDAPLHQILSRTPAPGEVVDLGDVVLPEAGVIAGTVVDEDGEPVVGALVRAADLPGTLAQFFPIERFDPKGAVLVRQESSPVKVVEMPAWVEDAFEHLPIPSTRSDGEGRFRLVGVVPGSNLLATTCFGYLSDTKPSVIVRAGQVKDVGRVKLKRGAELDGRVLDSKGDPVAGAEVLAGSTILVAPVDFAQRLGTSDARGQFHGQGFVPGKVTVAARRGPGQPWVLAEPQDVEGDVVVTLPAVLGADVAVALPDGKVPAAPRFRLLQGRAGEGAAEMALFGLVPPVDLKERLRPVPGENGEAGRWRIDGLLPGRYTLLADAPGHATAFAVFELQERDAQVALQLVAKKQFAVRVLTLEDQPVRNAAVYAEARGEGRRAVEMPLHCGRTDREGRLSIDKFDAESLRVSADHPRWGTVHGEVKVGAELVLRMQPPGALRGVLTENGKPPEMAKYSVTIERRGGGGPRGPLEQVPALLTPGLDGSFAAAALQPGSYRVGVIKSLDALRSPGGVFALAQEMFLARNLPREDAEIAAGQTTEVRIDAGEKPIDGPTASLSGSVTVDGRVGVDYYLTLRAKDRNFNTKSDRTGRFDFGVVPAGEVQLSLLANSREVFSGPGTQLWSAQFQLAENEPRSIDVTVATSSVAGMVVRADGSPVPGVFVQARGQLKSADGKARDSVWLGAPTDSQGRFSFSQVAEGTWSFDVRGNGEQGGRGRLADVVVVGGLPQNDLRIQVVVGISVKGRVDLAGFGEKKPRWLWLQVHQLPADGGAGVGDHVAGIRVDSRSGEFKSDELQPGTFRVQMWAAVDNNESKQYRCGDITVVAPAVEGIVLRPIPE
ncbi:MAG: hypothetical protein JNK49_05460 [Planctomycetes bacterium]|nr:hypothetical protein [Planctomycetota bacterium]